MGGEPLGRQTRLFSRPYPVCTVKGAVGHNTSQYMVSPEACQPDDLALLGPTSLRGQRARPALHSATLLNQFRSKMMCTEARCEVKFCRSMQHASGAGLWQLVCGLDGALLDQLCRQCVVLYHLLSGV